MSLAADGNGLHLEKLRLNFQVVSMRLEKINMYGRGWFFLCELKEQCPGVLTQNYYKWRNVP